MNEKRTARMSTSREAGEGISRKRIRELVDENRALRRKIHDSKRKEMTLRDRILRNLRKTFEDLPVSPSSPTRSDAGTQTGDSPASWSMGKAQASPPLDTPTPCGSRE